MATRMYQCVTLCRGYQTLNIITYNLSRSSPTRKMNQIVRLMVIADIFVGFNISIYYKNTPLHMNTRIFKELFKTKIERSLGNGRIFFIIARVVVVIHDDLCDNEGLSTNTDIPYTMNDVLYKSK